MATQRADTQGGGPGTRGYGGLFHDRYRDRHDVMKEVATWSIRYYGSDGRQHTESAHTTDRRTAEELLQERIGAVRGKTWTKPQADKVLFDELAADLVTEYVANKRRSLDRAEDAIQHLRAFFGQQKASAITATRITAYIAQRQTQDRAANGTINRELAALKKMLNLGAEHDKVLGKRPRIKLLEEDNVRTGFFERDQFEALRRHLPEHLKPLITAAYITGWRIRSELCSRLWQHVDWQAGFLKLDPGEGKTKKGRQFPLTGMLRAVLEMQRSYTETCQKEQGRIIPQVFHKDGKPLKHFRRAWLSACTHAGLPGKIPHDFRRTAVRNLERSGVSRSAAMKMVGHKTESIYRRYAIVNESDLRHAGEQLSQQEIRETRGESRKESGPRSMERER